MRAGDAGDEPVDAQPGQVVAGLVHGVVGAAEQSGHQGAQALVGDAGDGEQLVHRAPARAWTRGSPNRKAGALLPILGEGGPCDPLKGWTRKDAALTDTFSIEQAAVDRTGAGLQLVEMGQAARGSAGRRVR